MILIQFSPALVEHWQQLVDGHVDNPIGEPTRVGPPAETICNVCGLPTMAIALAFVTMQAEDLRQIWTALKEIDTKGFTD